MSREIKFRAWDKETKAYVGDTQLGFSLYEIALSPFEHVDKIKEIEFEQYTGFTDKNGKEIYEGDILGGIFEGCYIGWCDITKSFELFNCYEHYCMACDGDILWCELSDSDIDLEVIGNVHENPELLEGK